MGNSIRSPKNDEWSGDKRLGYRVARFVGEGSRCVHAPEVDYGVSLHCNMKATKILTVVGALRLHSSANSPLRLLAHFPTHTHKQSSWLTRLVVSEARLRLTRRSLILDFEVPSTRILSCISPCACWTDQAHCLDVLAGLPCKGNIPSYPAFHMWVRYMPFNLPTRTLAFILWSCQLRCQILRRKLTQACHGLCVGTGTTLCH